MTENNSFYVCEQFPLFLFETREGARDWLGQFNKDMGELFAHMRPSLNYCKNGCIAECASSVSAYQRIQIWPINSGELIFVVEKNKQLWHVIIGEKAGWIAVLDWLNIQPVEQNKNGIRLLAFAKI